MRLSDVTNILVRKLIRVLLRLFYVFPIKTNRVMLKSFYGKGYSCNPKYICEHLRNYYPLQFELLFVLNYPSDYPEIEGVRFIKNHSLSFYYYRFTSKIIISNMTDEVYIPKRKNQIFINTWHAGGAYKKVGKSYTKRQHLAADWQNKIVRQETDYYLSSSELFTTHNIRDAYHFTGSVLNYGLPRNDFFFDEGKIAICREQISSRFQLHGKFVILYAPTFRGDFAHTESIDFTLPVGDIARAIKKKYDKNVVFLNRSHYNDSKKLTTGTYEKCQIIDVSDYPDMQELLAASDLLITDYSSSIWDYALLNRPCLLYVPDLVAYEGDRGTYTPLSSWPGYVCETAQELVQTIENLDIRLVCEKATNHLKSFGSFETGTSSQQVAELLLYLINDREKAYGR